MQSVKTFLGDIFLSYFPEGKIKSNIKCFIANNYSFKNLDFRAAYRNEIFIINLHQNNYKFCENPINDFFEITEGYLRKYTIKKGDLVVDCGAYQGTFTVVASN